MAGVNKVILVGRLGADPEVKTIGSGNTVARINVATSESWVKNGQRQEKVEWHRVTVWGKLAELVGKHLQKGREVYIEGKLQTRSWNDQQGNKRYTTEVVASRVQFLGSKNGPSRNQSEEQTEFSGDDSPLMGDFSEDEGALPSFNDDETISF